MSYRNDLYEDIAKRFKGWLRTSNTGEFITDLALDYINRAQRSLNAYRPWKWLLQKRYALVLVDRSVALPSNLTRIVSAYDDSNGDGLPDNFYYENSIRTSDGYYITESFSKATGKARTITFYNAPSNTVYLDYLTTLVDFAGAGDEYSFFPGELLLAKAQTLNLEDDGRIGTDEYKMIINRLQSELNDFTQAQVENYDMRTEAKDDHGRSVAVESYSLSNGTDEGVSRRYDNDVDV